ncbi:MAG: DUF427 domain-containing protein [Planctomycetota bacterium]
MAKATYNGTVIAESTDTIVMEGNHYFPPESLNKEYIKDSTHNTICPHKGTASYYNVEVDGQVAENAVWYYPETHTDYAKPIEGYYAFWNGVTVEA